MTIGEAFEDFAVGEQINEVTEEEDGVGHYEDPILDSIAVEDGTTLSLI